MTPPTDLDRASRPARTPVRARRSSSRAVPVGVLALVVACALAVVPPRDAGAQDAPQDVPDHLKDELAAALVRFPDLTADGEVGIVVLDARGEPVWDHDGGVGLVPASTMKSLTATAALDTFGMDGTLSTTVRAHGPVGPDGVVDGPLVLRGVGDPTLTTDDYRRWVYPARPSSAIEDLADATVAAGVRRVTGSVAADGTAFGPASTAASGWPERYFGDYDAHNISGLTIDTGRRVEVSGSPVSVTITQEKDPAFRAVEVFAQALADRGVVIDGRVASLMRPDTAATTEVASLRSPPMQDVLRFMLQESDNHLADQLVRAAALEAVDDGSWTAAGDGVREALAADGVSTSGFVLSDGSGLSRTNRVSAALLAANDHAQFGRWGPAWSDLLPVAGESGTLENRLVGTPAQGRLVAKTGTLGDVRGLAGHVVADDGADGGPYHLALLVNDVSSDIRWQASLLGDELALVLADALDGCRRTRVVEVAAATPSPAASPTPAATPSAPSASSPSTAPSTAPATVERTVTATAADPGPELSSDAWTRDCP